MFQKKNTSSFLKKNYHAQALENQKKKKKKGNVIVPKKKKKRRQLDEAHVHMHMDIFFNQEKMHPHSIFSPFWWAQRENTSIPPFIFLPFHPTKHTLKKFSFPFSLWSFPSTLFHLQTNTPLIMPLSVKAISYCPLLFAIDPSSLLQSNNGMPLPRTSKGCFQSENNF